MAAALDVELYENFTDVDCVYSVNPHIISNPIPIYELTYSEMRELSYAGFSIFHEEALVPVYHKGNCSKILIILTHPEQQFYLTEQILQGLL